jgi:glyoxylase-like metal-dependent hydrolase (beta-lactamase superfamily II)
MMTAQSANYSNKLLVATFPVGALQCNCSIIADPVTKEAAVIDPGGDPDDVVKLLEEHGLKAKYILHTHAHFDHIMGSRAVKEKTGAQICLHKEDEWLYNNLSLQGKFVGWNLTNDQVLPVDHYLEDDEDLQLGDVKTKVIHTPGHTPGSTCFAVAHDESILFAGDTLFQHSIGRTDLWGGSHDTIIKSITGKLFRLDDGTEVVAGHGPNTTSWEEKRHNPYVA